MTRSPKYKPIEFWGYHNGTGSVYQQRPQIAKFWKRNTDAKPHYCIIGTPYGYHHTTSGQVKIWSSYSGAYRMLKWYRQQHPIKPLNLHPDFIARNTSTTTED